MADEIVVGATRKSLVATIVDTDGNVVNLTGGSVKLQGRSSDLSAKTIDATGTLTDPQQGVVTFSSLGTLVTQAELTAATISTATFRCRLKFTDASAKIDFGPAFELMFVKDPLIL